MRVSSFSFLVHLKMLSGYASRIEYRDGQDTRPTIIVEKLTVKLDAQQLILHDLLS
jgi:hypothetical protein